MSSLPRLGDHARQPRTRTPLVDQHATWIAVNPVQGCPKACVYCFLNERGQTSVRPEQLATPAEAIDSLLASPLYDRTRPVALYTWTDVMAVPASRTHLAQMLDLLTRRELPNPVVLITKCHIPDDMIAAIVAARRGGLRVIVYVSYSGLGPDIERGIRHEAVAANFPRLAKAGVPVVHYWRPAFPASATTQNMHRVIDWASRFARCTVAAGLKVEQAAVPRLAQVWPELADTEGVADAEGVYPRPFWGFLHGVAQLHPHYPLFHTNSCALAYVLGQPDQFGVLGSTVCRLRNTCPPTQRDVCSAAARGRRTPASEEIGAALRRRGLVDVAFTLAPDGHELVIDAAVDTATTAALTQDLGIRVKVTRQDTDVYWSSGTVGALPLILG